MNKIDTPRLRKTLEWALSEHRKAERGEPSEWLQEDWLSTAEAAYRSRLLGTMGSGAINDRLSELDLSQECGTACCIAGKIVLDAGYQPYMAVAWGSTAYVYGERGERTFVSDLAMRLLLGRPELFFPEEYQLILDLFRGDNKIRDLYDIAAQLTDGEITMPAELLDGEN